MMGSVAEVAPARPSEVAAFVLRMQPGRVTKTPPAMLAGMLAVLRDRAAAGSWRSQIADAIAGLKPIEDADAELYPVALGKVAIEEVRAACCGERTGKRDAMLIEIDAAIVKADKLVEAADDPGYYRRPDLPQGAARWIRNDAGMPKALAFVCPCGCGIVGRLAITTGNVDSSAPRAVWQWNGDERFATLTPSVRKTSRCGWHGELREGIFREL